MHFSIPETELVTDDKGSSFWNFHIHVNGVYHCKQRYSQLDKFNEQLQQEFVGRIPSRLFPGKKLFALSVEGLEERREQLERYVQYVSQDPIIGVSDVFNDFFLQAQQADSQGEAVEVTLDIYLMNGNKVSVSVQNTDQTDHILETAMKQIGLEEKYYNYFALYLVERGKSNNIKLVRKLQEFESPYMSLQVFDTPHRIVIRKNYWSSKYDEDLLDNRIAMNLLYVQIIDDFERGWMLCTDQEKEKLEQYQNNGSRKELLKMASGLRYYGYVHYEPCKADYPCKDSTVYLTSGDREFNIRVKTDDQKIMEGSFRVQRIRSWRLSSLPNSTKRADKLHFAFEYLFAKNDIKWITVESTQAVMLSMAMQGMVDEIIREQQGKGIRKFNSRRNSVSSSSSENSLSSKNPQPEGKNKARKSKRMKAGGKNEVFANEDIGDDDL